MAAPAVLTIHGESYELPVVVGTEGDLAIDISTLRERSGWITLDDSFANTGACQSKITFIDGDRGVLRYRGIPIEDLAAGSDFVEAAQLLIFGELPDPGERSQFSTWLTQNAALHRGMISHFESFPASAHPMAILSAMVNTLGTYEVSDRTINDEANFERAAAALMSKTRTIAAASYKASIGQPIIHPRYDMTYVENFLHMMFSVPYRPHEPIPEVTAALNQFLVLHADHEQNCSTSTVRMVASSQANLFASCAAGVCALWGPLHGGANQAVIEMLTRMREEGITPAQQIAQVKDKASGIRLMGFGHRVYRNFDPRATILKEAADRLLGALRITDPLLDLARELEAAALADDYFVQRKLYPNVDFYSGIILRAIGIPVEMFTVMFALGRMPGWIAHWKEVHDDVNGRIHRPRQVYVGKQYTAWTPSPKR